MSFDSTGALAALAIGPILLRLFEGFVTGVTEHPTTQANADEKISIAPVTGRVCLSRWMLSNAVTGDQKKIIKK